MHHLLEKLVAGLLLLATVLTGGSPGHERPDRPPTTRPEPPGRAVPVVGEDALYTPPRRLPAGEPGDLIQVTAPRPSAGGGTEQRILYRSTAVDGKPTAVSGVVYVPDDVAPDAPVLSLGHGTIGLADCDAPSRQEDVGEAELAWFAGLAREGTSEGLFAGGAIVVASDFEGLGTPGPHAYVVGRSEGANVLDAVRAARRLTETEGDSVVVGHSQGGGAALWAAQMAPTYAPDARLVGAVAGSPAVELREMMSVLPGTDQFAYVFLAAAGFDAAYPQLDLSSYLTPAGLEVVDDASTSCGLGVFEEVAGQPAERYLQADPASVEPFAGLLDENSPGDVATPVPVLLYHGDDDEVIPVRLVGRFFERVCRAGDSNVDVRTYPGADHHSIKVAALADTRSFLADRLAGAPFQPTACS